MHWFANMQFKQVSINVNNICNLKCGYCFVDKKPNTMTQATASHLIKKLRELVVKNGKVHFFGTEPTISWNVLQNIVTSVEWARPDIKFSMTTNGVLIDDKKAKYLAAYNFGILLSCDGSAHVHDMYRKRLNGSPTHNLVLQGWDRLLKAGIVPGIAATVNPKTVKYLLESAEFLLNRKQRYVHFNINTLVEWNAWDFRTYWKQLYKWYYSKEPADKGTIGNFASKKGKTKPERTTCGACHGSIGFDWDGSAYPCHRTNLDSIGDCNTLNIENINKVRAIRFSDCKTCPVWPCSTCYSNNVDSTGSLTELNDEWCKIQAMKWQVVKELKT